MTRLKVPLLLDGEVAPLAMRWGFLRCGLDTAIDALRNWQSGADVQFETLPPGLRRGLSRLDPLTPSWTRLLLVECEGGWTAVFDNGARGGDPVSVLGPITRSLGLRGVAVACVPGLVSKDGAQAFYEQVQLEILKDEPTEFLNYERTISVTDDASGWEFSARGTPQPFEVTERYRAESVRERFDGEMLRAYCQALGIRLFDESFYAYRAVVASYPAKRAKRTSLRSARAELALDGLASASKRRWWSW